MYDFADDLRGPDPDPKSRFIALYLIALVAVAGALVWCAA